MTWGIELKYNTIFKYETYRYHMYDYDIEYNVDIICMTMISSII